MRAKLMKVPNDVELQWVAEYLGISREELLRSRGTKDFDEAISTFNNVPDIMISLPFNFNCSVAFRADVQEQLAILRTAVAKYPGIKDTEDYKQMCSKIDPELLFHFEIQLLAEKYL